MKRLITTLTLLSTLLVFGCTKVVYTHQEVIDRYKTKQEVSDRFGQPAERMVLNGTEQWLYNMDPSAASMSPNDVTQFSRFKKYILFTFDAQGNVLKSDSKGVDLAERKPAAGGTIAIVAGGVAVVALIIAAASFHVNLSGMKF